MPLFVLIGSQLGSLTGVKKHDDADTPAVRQMAAMASDLRLWLQSRQQGEQKEGAEQEEQGYADGTSHTHSVPDLKCRCVPRYPRIRGISERWCYSLVSKDGASAVRLRSMRSREGSRCESGAVPPL